MSRNRTFHPRSDSGISSLLPSDSFKYLTWHKVEQHDIQGSQLHCPRVREGPSTEELLFRQEECTLPALKRVLEKNKWETWLQENWEDCTGKKIQHLSLAENHIESLTGLSSLWCTPLESLTLKRNPCEFHPNYWRQVFSCLPNLKMLDGILKLPEDSSPPETNIFSK
ncbi:hypothetical protein GH733_002768, partial [Mirounga leonina]